MTGRTPIHEMGDFYEFEGDATPEFCARILRAAARFGGSERVRSSGNICAVSICAKRAPH